ncbi:hypothetical protein [Campylobacter avium]|uniref:hypothetical protein n=1 Tax=Campylobacter avium TaxID=522485 RepID=UPI00146F483D|nr:hypothetical protein [Campylobacter avium]
MQEARIKTIAMPSDKRNNESNISAGWIMKQLRPSRRRCCERIYSKQKRYHSHG